MANSDGISFTWDAHEFTDMTDEIGPITRRATMYAMRATGRALAQVARGRAPVYHGDDPRPTPGDLRKSIKNARSMDSGGDVYQLKVGPFGSKKKGTSVTRHGESKGQVRGIPLYRGKMEAMYGFMAGAAGAANAGIAKGVFESAYAKAWAKWTE